MVITFFELNSFLVSLYGDGIDFMDVLIVEDEPSTVLDLKTILRNLGHDVVAIASTGDEALKEAGDLNPDLIIIDIKLKGVINSVETANKISNLYDIPVLFLTDFIKNCLIKSLQFPENAVVLSKPIKQEHLEYVLAEHFSNMS